MPFALQVATMALVVIVAIVVLGAGVWFVRKYRQFLRDSGEKPEKEQTTQKDSEERRSDFILSIPQQKPSDPQITSSEQLHQDQLT